VRTTSASVVADAASSGVALLVTSRDYSRTLVGSPPAAGVASGVVSTPTAASRTATWVGIVVGVVSLGLIVAFAIALPKGADADASSAPTGELTLPDTLPGGYTAADLPEAFTGKYADRADEVSKQQRSAREHGDEVLTEVLDEPAATRTYASKDLQTAVFVQGFRAAGGAFAPDSLPDPADAQPGQSVPELLAVGDAACIVTPQSSQTGQPVPESTPPAYAQCQVSEGELTVQVGAQGLQAEAIVEIADHVLGLLQDQ
jgi:hypothetical protein